MAALDPQAFGGEGQARRGSRLGDAMGEREYPRAVDEQARAARLEIDRAVVVDRERADEAERRVDIPAYVATISATARTKVLPALVAALKGRRNASVPTGRLVRELTVTLLPAIYLSGFFFPLAAMPAWLRAVSYAIPLRYFLVIARGIVVKGVGMSALWPQALALAVFASIVTGLAISRFRKSLD